MVVSNGNNYLVELLFDLMINSPEFGLYKPNLCQRSSLWPKPSVLEGSLVLFMEVSNFQHSFSVTSDGRIPRCLSWERSSHFCLFYHAGAEATLSYGSNDNGSNLASYFYIQSRNASVYHSPGQPHHWQPTLGLLFLWPAVGPNGKTDLFGASGTSPGTSHHLPIDQTKQ